MKNFIDNVGRSIPMSIKLSTYREVITGKSSLILYGFFEYTGFRGFWKKVKQGIKANRNA